METLLALLMMLLQQSHGHDETVPCHDENKYSFSSNQKLSHEEMFIRGHMHPFGSHRPPMKIEILPFMISPQDFYMKYVVKHKPVVFKGVTQSWPAYNLWTDDYLLRKFGNVSMRMETKNDDKINIPEDRYFKEFLKVYNSTNLYLVDEVLPQMQDDVLVPLCLQCEEMDRFFFVSFYWHSNGGTSSTVHIDTDENLLCVIRGHKKVIMVSPIYSHDLYADESRIFGVLDINSTAVDLLQYPNILNVRHYEAELEEGDCVYIPQTWWHQVYSRKGRQQAIAMWWKSKPDWKRTGGSEKAEKRAKPIQEDKQKQHSYANTLIEYEEWIQMVAETVPPIKCEEQRKVMSGYLWETDHDSNAPVSFGDGGSVEEDVIEQSTVKTFNEIREEVKQRSMKEQTCDFDRANMKSPCYHASISDPSDLNFIRYVLDYCQQYEDRGCIINRPHILNKLSRNTFQDMAFRQKSKFQS